MTAAALDIRDLHCAYEPGHEVLRGVTLQVEPGECVAVIGPNGAGKSTLVLTLAGFLEPLAGSVAVGGTGLAKNTLAEMRRKMGFLFQNLDDQLFMPTVREDLLFGPLKAGVALADAEKRAQILLERLELGAIAHIFPGHLSGGQKRLASLAAVLSLEPELLVLDEPTSYLDPHARRCFIRHLAALPQARLVSTHDLEMILEVCSRVVILNHGQIVASGVPSTLLSDAALMAAHGLEVPYSLRGRH
jgi:cobalt/nickel transport system ATP-binding protein